MANAKKCDRCGAYYDCNSEYSRMIANEKVYYSGVALVTTGGHRVDIRDFCDSCMADFKKFLGVEKLRC